MAALFIPYRFTPSVVRQVVEPNRTGSYILGFDKNGFVGEYVGRSDSCLYSRLSKHNHLLKFDYFIFKYASNIVEAFFQECELYHTFLTAKLNLQNMVHPASPAGSNLNCPYCQFRNSFANLQ